MIVEVEQIVQRGAIERLACACNEYTTNKLPFHPPTPNRSPTNHTASTEFSDPAIFYQISIYTHRYTHSVNGAIVLCVLCAFNARIITDKGANTSLGE